MRFGTHTDLDSGEILAAYLADNRLNSVMTTGRTVSADTQPTGFQGNIVKQDNDPLGWDMEISAQLQNGFSGQIHVCHRLQQKQFPAALCYLPVKSLEFGLIDFTA